MSAFIKKLKRANKLFLTILIVSLLLYLVGYITFTINVLSLKGIETLIRIIIIILFGLWFFTWLIFGLVKLFTKKYSSFIIMSIFTFLFTGVFFFGSYYIHTIYSKFDDMSKNTVTYTTNLIKMKSHEFNNEDKIGIISDTNNLEGNILAKKLIENDQINNSLYQYDDFYEMLDDLYNGTIGACFVSANYGVLFSSEEKFSNIINEVNVIKSYSEERKNEDNISYTSKKLTEPFTILVMGVDSEIDGLNANQAFNGDTLMLVTFNPKTLTASMFSLPRDLYVPISCRNNALAKINSSAAYGTSCVISTIKNLTNIDINYYVKINFKGVVDLVDALGGITIDVEKPYFTYNNGIDYHGQVCEQNSNRDFGSNIICLNPGIQTINGEQALAYSRNRHQYIGSDLDRIRHQQEVVSSIAAQAKTIRSFEDFEKLLTAVQKNMDTNMTTEQILSLYTVGKSIIIDSLNGNSVNLSMNKTILETYSLPVFIGSSTTSALGYYKSSLDDITKMMRVNLEIEEAEINKTFSIDYNEDYTTKFYGKGYYSSKSVETMPSLIGSSSAYAQAWALDHSINLNIIEVLPGEEHFNSLYNTGIVADQSIHINSLIGINTNLTIYVNKASETITNNPINKNENINNDDHETIDGENNKNEEETTTPIKTPEPIIPGSPENKDDETNSEPND